MTDDAITRLAQTMAIEDQMELWAMSHDDSETGLRRSLARSFESDIWMPDGEPLCAYGVAVLSLVPLTVSPWLLASQHLPSASRAFLRGSRHWMEEQASRYPRLVNYVGAWHTRSLRWLDWLGFAIDPPQRMGLERYYWHCVTKEGI